MSTVRMYQLIEKARTELNQAEAEELVNEFKGLIDQRFDDRKEMLATKIDLAETEKRISEEIADVKVDVAEVKVDLGKDMNRIYRSLLTWIVVMGILNAIPEIIDTILKNL